MERRLWAWHGMLSHSWEELPLPSLPPFKPPPLYLKQDRQDLTFSIFF